MKIITIKKKTQMIALAVFVVLGTCSLVNGTQVLPANKQLAANLVMSRNFRHKHLPMPEYQQPQTQSSNAVANLPANTQGSNNWAGYINTPDAGKSYTSVSGTWTVPNISASQDDAVAAQWIGLGGVSSNDLLQMGTVEEIENGQPVAKIFWEQLPSTAQNVMTVPIGSTINASISPSADSSSTWNLTFTVNGQSPAQTIPPVTLDSDYAQGIGTSAEWISEDPSNQNGQLYPLANMGSVSYQAATVNGQPFDSIGNVQPLALVSKTGNVLIAPSEIGSDEKSFATNVISSNTNTGTTSRYRQSRGPQYPSSWIHVSIIQGSQGDNFTWTWEF
ncbi:Peptidase A4 family [Desulfosporosinus acidiphilus SJ4]|uniref:Peptidase A4 family n=1 Tax=Desulfosporosinus acidiphilus (strain DSM 22704 / JCM 16185 / SJ4) TaxID=646529 RepID=I4D9J4_DESAJ|nr:G1 family glutamic endopeptidase [Desulfosporosinus acidiphilus]AFM42468.1 Peptidase A4 family [Desulfosporosinus acidiphilus SJ4]